MRRTLAFSLVFLTTFLVAFGNTYRGVLTQTITATNDPLYQVGQTFVGSYQYETASVDGIFYTAGYIHAPLPSGVNYTLDGLVYTPFATEAYFNYEGHPYHLNYGPGGMYKNFLDTPTNAGELVVENGEVTACSWFFENGGFLMRMNGANFNAMSFYDRGPMAQVPKTTGTVVFSKPVNVPDVTGTLSLLAGSLLVLGLLRRRFAC